jgi:transposase InsO family protein
VEFLPDSGHAVPSESGETINRRAYDSVSEARASIGRYLDFYNGRRPHSSLDGMTPDQAYFTPPPIRLAA